MQETSCKAECLGRIIELAEALSPGIVKEVAAGNLMIQVPAAIVAKWSDEEHLMQLAALIKLCVHFSNIVVVGCKAGIVITECAA